MKETIKEFINNSYPESGIDSISGKFYMRFELGGNLINGTRKRVEHAVRRATEIYNQTIGEGQVLIVIEEYENELFDPKNKNKKYLFSIINETQFKRIQGPFEQTYEEYNGENKLENVLEDRLECDLVIGVSYIDKKKAKQIIEGIANLEMGFEPCIPQVLYFFSMNKKTGFRIYDDRGCDIWANDKEQLRPIYQKLNDWILDYDRPEIDKIFR
jgi:hypothetical protein